MKTALTIAGSDSSGGAGIQADIKTMTANGVFAMSAITALTAQNTTGVTDIFETTPRFLAEQLDAIFTDIYPDAVKIGMVSSAELIATIAEKLHAYEAKHIVVDPVMVATSGSKLLRDDAVQALTAKLLPMAEVLTPNIPEAEILSGMTITDAAGESIYDGSATGFRSYRFAENGTYDAKLIVSTSGTPADEATVTGTETWQFRFTVSIKPSIQLATDSVAQGGVAAVRVGQTLGKDAPAIKTTIKNVGFVKAGSGWICYLPIPWNQKSGSIDLEVSADGYTETLSLSVRAGSFSYKDYSKTSQMAAPYIGEDDAPAAVSKLFATVDDKIQWSVGGFVQPFLDSFDTPLTYGMTEYAGRSYSERGTNYGYGGRTSTNVIIRPKNGKGSMIAPASGRVLLAKDLGGLYGNTLVIEHGAGLKSIFYGLASLDVKTGDTVKQGQLLGGCSKAVVAEMRIGTVPIDPLAVWRSRCDGLKLY